MKPRIGRRRKVLAILRISIICTAALWQFRSRPQSDVVIFYRATSLPPSERSWSDRVDQLIPTSASWAWLWRLRYAVFDKRPTLQINAAYCDLTHVLRDDWASLGEASFHDNGSIGVWISEEKSLVAFSQRLAKTKGITSIMRFDTANEVESIGSTEMRPPEVPNRKEVVTGFLPRVKSGSVDLMGLFRITESVANETSSSPQIVTNFTLAARLQIPNGKGALLIETNSSGRIQGALITLKVPKGNK